MKTWGWREAKIRVSNIQCDWKFRFNILGKNIFDSLADNIVAQWSRIYLNLSKSRVQILLTVPIYSGPRYRLAYCCDWSTSSPKNTILIKHKANKHKNHTNMITLLLCGFTQHTLLILNDTNKYITN